MFFVRGDIERGLRERAAARRPFSQELNRAPAELWYTVAAGSMGAIMGGSPRPARASLLTLNWRRAAGDGGPAQDQPTSDGPTAHQPRTSRPVTGRHGAPADR
ncbi:hypothetical protein FJT64_002490 [Amphibalanus amphitrite]|uniref:Uncharacterized protein n=1 Tax=Amphibalanus amphitrite TaxID=1232801 RepID=A0A6A4WQ76_AMPAM|nr:hypothetical protein FJT64_002490 [Amphibalanus amphitrite]